MKRIVKSSLAVFACSAAFLLALTFANNHHAPVETRAESSSVESLVLGGHDGYAVDPYIAETPATSFEITYSGMKRNTYKNVYFSLVGDVSSYRELQFTVENKGAKSVKIRADVIGSEVALNTKAMQDGNEGAVYTATGQSTFSVTAGETSLIVIRYSAAADAIQLYVDSAWAEKDSAEDLETYSGDIVFGGLKYLDADYDFLKVDGSVDYTFHPSFGKSVTASYTNVAGNSYANASFDVLDGYSAARRVAFDVKNNGLAEAKVRVDVEAADTHETEAKQNIKAVNTSARKNGVTVYTDLNYGGSTVTLAAGEEASVIVDYNDDAVLLKFFFDSSTYNDENTYSGSITLSGLRFGYSKEAFARDLLKLTKGLCNSSYDGVTNNHDALASIWGTLSGSDYYDGLSGEEQAALVSAAGDSSVVVPTTNAEIDAMSDADALKAALYRYDYCTAKYGLENFITGRTSPAYVTSAVKLASQDNTGVVLTITFVAVALVAAAFVVFGLKKHHN